MLLVLKQIFVVLSIEMNKIKSIAWEKRLRTLIINTSFKRSLYHINPTRLIIYKHSFSPYVYSIIQVLLSTTDLISEHELILQELHLALTSFTKSTLIKILIYT